MTPQPTVTIIGAGLGGLTAALALMRIGWRVRVYEAAPVLGEVGAGISVAAGTGRGLAALGIGPALLAASLPVPAVAFAHYRSGDLLAGVYDKGAPVDRGFATARHIHRADLHAILLDAVRAIDKGAVLTGKRLVHATQDGDRAIAGFADGSVVDADLLIGADGARSTVRQTSFDRDAPQFAGQIAFRCLVPIERAAPFMTRGNAVVSVGAARMFHRYLVRGGSLVNVIGIGQNEDWREEGWNTPASPAEFLADYAADQAGNRNAQIVKEQLGRGVVQHRADRADGQAPPHRFAHVDQQHAHPVRRFGALVARRRAAQQHHQVGMFGAADPDFLPVDHVVVAIAACECGDPGGIGARARLGHAKRLQAQGAAGHLWQIKRLLRFAAMLQQCAHHIHLGMAGATVTA